VSVIVGIDEVGRGSWAGPLVAGAVILNTPVTGLKDSKKLTKIQRKKLAIIINSKALAVGLGWVSHDQVDKLGLTSAVTLAMRLAIQQIEIAYDEIIVDGNFNFLSLTPNSRSVINGDALIPSISAASIVAKVARDEFMSQIALKYPNYGFETHVGYGTARHLAAIRKYGVCSIHRLSYNPIKQALSP